jgi:hypothetical protein
MIFGLVPAAAICVGWSMRVGILFFSREGS